MSKKIISAILVMAMVISMSATALLSSVGAAAETDYEADRTALKDAIVNLVLYGPELETETIEYLKTLGFLGYNKDFSCNVEGCTCNKYTVLHNRFVFWKSYTDKYTVEEYLYKGTKGTDLAKAFVEGEAVNKLVIDGKLEWVKTPAADQSYVDLAKANISAVVEYAASAWYFGQDANNALVDVTFNEGRNALVKGAASMIKTIVDALKAEVGEGTDKPVAYAEYFMSENYKGFATAAKAYNQSIGFNPYLYVITDEDYIKDAEGFWGGDALGQYPVKWFTFAEAREIDAEGVFAFEMAIREIAMNNGKGKLFNDFVATDVAEFNKIVEDLFAKLIGDIKELFVGTDIDTQIKAFLKLEIIVDLYDLYIKDVYNNIYTATSIELLNDVLYAKRIIEYVRAADTNAKLMIIALSDFEAITADVLAGIAAVTPRSEQMLKSADITEGTALVRKAEALLANWANWKGQDNDYGKAFSALTTAKNNLKNMIPNAEGESVIVIVDANTRKLKNIAGTEIFNDKVVVEFTPNWFSYVKFYALLEAQIAHFTKLITTKDSSLSTDFGKNDDGALRDIINKYAFLAGVVGNIVTIPDSTKKITLVSTTDSTGAATANYKATAIYQNFLFESDYSMFKDDGSVRYADYAAFIARVLKNDAAGTAGRLDGVNTKADNSSLYEAVIGYVFGNNEYAGNIKAFGEDVVIDFLNQDAAIDNVVAFIATLADVVAYAIDDENYKNDAGEFDWVEETWSFTSSHAKQIAKLESAIKALTKDITKEIQTYYFVLAEIMNVFGWELDIVGVTEDGAMKEMIANIGNLIGQDNYELILEILERVAEGDYNHPILDEVKELVGEDNYETVISIANGILNGETAEELCWQEGSNYPNNFMDNARDDANELFSLMTIYMMSSDIKVLVSDALSAYDNAEPTLKDALNRAVPATYTTLKAALENFINSVKSNLLTDKGAAELDAFIEDVYTIVEGWYGENEADWNDYDMLLQKLDKSNVVLTKYFDDMLNCYEYFALTLAHAAACEEYTIGNKYYGMNGALEHNYLSKLNGYVGNTDMSGYTRDFAEKYNAVRELAAYVAASIKVNKDADKNITSVIVNTDMPVWYAERVLNELAAAWAEKDNYSVAALVEYKAGLEALLIEADGLNVYNYVSNTDEAKAIWADFVAAYTNAQYIALDTRCEFAKVDEAVAALTAAMAELEKIEAVDGASTVDTLNAKIAAAEALLARADVVDMAEEADLVLAINAAKKALQFNISVLNATDLDNLIKSLNDLMTAIEKEMYTGADLKKAVKVLELQVVVDLYTEASYRKFANAVESAYAMAEEDTATESAMMAAYANVEARFGDLKLAPVEEEPEVVEPETSVVMEEAIAIYNEAANGYDKAVEGCTAESAAAYNAAINTLKADIENNADDAKLLESIIALNLAKAALTVDVPETCDC